MTTAFVFPGQGSQSIGMQQELADAFASVRETYDEASDALGLDLWALTREGPGEQLDRTENTQPAVLCAGVAAWRVWSAESDLRPQFMAGHSLGEYTALVCGGALEFPQALRLVAARGRFMQDAVPEGEGAMAVILGLDDEAVRDVCSEASEGDVVQAVNFNAPGQVAIAGASAAVARAVVVAKERGAKRAMQLAVSVPSHCDLMRPAAEALREELSSTAIREPAIAIINNVDVNAESTPDAIRDALVRQLYNPVRWVETCQRLAADGAGTIVECGPGKVLAGLVRRIDKTLTIIALDSGAQIETAKEAVATSEGERS